MNALGIAALIVAGIFLLIGAYSIYAAQRGKAYNVTFEGFGGSSSDLSDVIIGLIMGALLATFGVALKFLFGRWGPRGIYSGQAVICFVIMAAFLVLAVWLR